MKRKLSTKHILLIVLLVLPLAFSINATVTIKEDVVFRTVDNNVRFVMGSDFDFYKTEVNSTHLWLDKSYISKYYTRYCIYVYSPSSVNLTVNTWFATANSSGTLTITAPTSTNINLGFYSPNLVSASVSGTVTSAWHSGNQTLTMTVNTDTSATFTISATVNQTKEANITPENNAIIITDMDAGNWVFSETKYYTFQARYWDGNGYADLDTVKIRFSDGLTTVTPIYDRVTSEWSLESGSDVVRLQAGTLTIIDSNLIQVTFLIYFRNTILDALDVDLEMWCNDTSGASDGWGEIQTDYFNIYNLGGHSIISSYGEASRLVGGDVFDLYAYNNSWVDNYMIFKNLQHVKLLPLITYTNELAILNWSVTMYMDYCVGDTWVEGLKAVLHPPYESEFWFYRTTKVYHNLTVDWYNHGEFVRSDVFYIYNYIADDWLNASMNLWFDFWINKENASSIIGGRLNAYYFPMTDSSQAWLRWLTGSNWGIDEGKKKQTMFFETMLDANGETLHASEISLVHFGVRLQCWSDNSAPVKVQISDFDVFDLTLGANPFTGVQTPVFDETKVPVMPQGGFLGAIWTALVNLGKAISDALGPVVLGFWNAFVGFLDTVFSAFGWPNGFSTILHWIDSLLILIGDSFTYLISLLTSVFTFLGAIIGKMLNTLSTFVTQWVNIIQNIFSMLGGGLGTGINIWDSLGLSTWVIIIAILYPVFLLAMWEEKGIDAVINHIQMMLNILAWIGRIFLTVIQLFITVITSIIESIPVVE